jgi:hypothetical protein
MQIGAKPQAQRLNAKKINLLAEEPTRIIFAKTIGGDEWQIFVIGRVGDQVGTGFDQASGLIKMRRSFARLGHKAQQSGL